MQKHPAQHQRPMLALFGLSFLFVLTLSPPAMAETVDDVLTATSMVRQTASPGTNYFMGTVTIGTNVNASGSALHVAGAVNIEGACTVPAQGDVGMSGYTNGVSTAGIVSSNIALNGHWVSGDGENEGVYVATDGKAGVGTSSPEATLHVNGNLQLQNGTNVNEISTDTEMGGASPAHTRLSTQKSIRDYVDSSNANLQAQIDTKAASADWQGSNANLQAQIDLRATVSDWQGSNANFQAQIDTKAASSDWQGSNANLQAQIDAIDDTAKAYGYSATNRSCADDTWYKLVDTEEYDTGGDMTSGIFYAPHAGYYLVSAQARLYSAAQEKEAITVRVVHNQTSAELLVNSAAAPLGHYVGVNVGAVLYLTNNMPIKAQMMTQGAATQTVCGGKNNTFFCITEVH